MKYITAILALGELLILAQVLNLTHQVNGLWHITEAVVGVLLGGGK